MTKEQTITRLVEKTVIKESSPYYKEMKKLCRLSKNLYNSTLYEYRQAYINKKEFLTHGKVNKLFIRNNQKDYRALPAKVSQQTQKLVEQNMKSFKAKIKSDKRTKLPKYRDKKGFFIIIYDKQALSFKHAGHIKLSQTNILIPTRIPKEQIKQVRISPRGNHFVVETVYVVKVAGFKKLEETKFKVKNTKGEKFLRSNIASIDLGVDNLASVAGNKIQPYIINGKSVKSINQFANKKVAELRSKKDLLKINTSRAIERTYTKRYNKIMDYFHKASRQLVNYLVSNGVDTVIVGYTTGWKQETSIGKKNNQNFVNIPQMVRWLMQI